MISGTVISVNGLADIKHKVSNKIITGVNTRDLTYYWKYREGESTTFKVLLLLLLSFTLFR